jgi:vancomycin resistance protein YoaR
MRPPQPRLIIGLGAPLLVLVLLLAAWAIDSSSAGGKVPRNVELAGRDVGKLPEDELANAVADIADRYAGLPVQVRTTEDDYRIAAGDLGLALDQQATIDAALELDDDTALAARPFVWASSFLADRTAPLVFTVDPVELEAGLATLGGNAAPTEPQLVVGADALSILSGANGLRVLPDGVADQLVRRAEAEIEPLIVDAEVVEEEPEVSDAEAQDLAEHLNVTIADGLTVIAGDERVTFPAAVVRNWLGAEVEGSELQVTLDADQALVALVATVPTDPEVRAASFTVEGGNVVLLPSKSGTSCCAPDSTDRILAALEAGESSVTVELEVVEPDLTTEEAEALNIVEPVGGLTVWNDQPQVRSFTTYYDPDGGGRVTNIQRMADIVRGTLVLPGEQFSINDVVGQRTAEKGFVDGGAIADGELVQEVGGGVSQFSTTMFNAAFFAGLPINTYQAHSEYFDRYPYGREATMGFPDPDLVWTNDTPHGILVWSTHTPDSVTVTFYSTQHAFGQQTGQTEGRSGSCTTVSTERTITYPDGRTATDSFNARYRDAGRTSC